MGLIPGIGVALSAMKRNSIDGKYMAITAATASVAKYLFVSSDYGVTWNQVGSTQKFVSLAFTDDGSKIYALIQGVGVCVSTNMGVNWSTVYSNTSSLTALAISGDGQYMILSTDTTIYKSSNYGANFTTLRSGNTSKSASISRTGQYQAYSYNSTSTGRTLCQSNDYGATWTTTGYSSTTELFVSMSKDGQYRVLIRTNTYIAFSSNYGASWTQPLYLNMGTTCSYTAASGNGQYMMGVGDYTLQSADYGATAATKTGIKKMAYSETGKYQLYAVSTSAKFRVSSDYGATYLQPVSTSEIWTLVAINQFGG